METEKTVNELKKEFLGSYQKHVRRVKRIERELEELRIMKVSISVNNDGMPKGNTRSDLSSYVAKLDELESELIRERYKRIQVYNDILKSVNKMDDEIEKDILFYRYIVGYGWWKVAEQLGYTERHITRLHGKALQHFNLPTCPRMSD